IVSRCEVLRLRPLPTGDVEAYLTQRGTDPAQARLLASLSGGRPGAAIRLYDNPDSLSTRAERLDDFFRLLRAPRRERFAYAEKMTKDKDALRAALLTWGACWRDVMLRAAKPGAAIANLDYEPAIADLAAHLGLPAARRMVSLMEQSVERLEKNVNARLLVETLMLDWPRV
ncbi:MAG: DNA polymerase III subunit delta' C-terminal domain-containing protein, partial [Anaerolineales bacterium]